MARSPVFAVFAASLVPLLAVPSGCKREEAAQPQPAFPPPPTASPSAGWTAAPTAQPTATAAQPAPYAPPCENPEGTCGWARCNMAIKRCMWPCGSDADCIAGAHCVGPAGLSQCIGGFAR